MYDGIRDVGKHYCVVVYNNALDALKAKKAIVQNIQDSRCKSKLEAIIYAHQWATVEHIGNVLMYHFTDIDVNDTKKYQGVK